MLVGLFNCKKFAWRSMQSKLSQEANKHSTYSCDPNSVWLGIYLTNREAFPRLCSVATHQGSGYGTNGEFCLCSGYGNVNCDAYHDYKSSFGSFADGVTALAMLYVLNSDRARSFNQSLRYWLWGYRQWL